MSTLTPLLGVLGLSLFAPEPSAVEVHGFVSQGSILTTGNDYLVPGTKDGSFQVSEAGINFTRQLDSKLRVGMQLFVQNFASTRDYDVRADWFYVDYRFKDWLGFRAGRLKIPFGLYNEVNDIDSARVPILLPQSVYPQQSRSFLFAQTGAELYGYTPVPYLGALEYQMFGGTIFVDPALVSPPSSQVEIQFNVPYVVGGRALWDTPLPGLRLGGSVQKLRLDVVAHVGPTTVEVTNDSLLWAGSAEYVFRDLSLTAEYSRWHSVQESNLPGSELDVTSERAYVMANYAIASWLHPGAYYSVLYPDADFSDLPGDYQYDAALTLRFNVNANWLIKLEGHHMSGTAGLVNPIEVNPLPPSEQKSTWAVFLAKTTLSF